MIARLHGMVDTAGGDWVVLDVGGVGYHLTCSTRTLAALPPPGAAATLHTEMLVSDNAIRLIGFASPVERDWFRLLDQVQGVGARVALAVLSTLAPDELAAAVALHDTATVARAPGVGKKVAERICAELRDKVPAGAGEALPGALAGAGAVFDGPAADAVSALVNLGYARTQAAAAVAAAARAESGAAGTEALIRAGLKELAR